MMAHAMRNSVPMARMPASVRISVRLQGGEGVIDHLAVIRAVAGSRTTLQGPVLGEGIEEVGSATLDRRCHAGLRSVTETLGVRSPGLRPIGARARPSSR